MSLTDTIAGALVAGQKHPASDAASEAATNAPLLAALEWHPTADGRRLCPIGTLDAAPNRTTFIARRERCCECR